jgi:hypothetical protein
MTWDIRAIVPYDDDQDIEEFRETIGQAVDRSGPKVGKRTWCPFRVRPASIGARAMVTGPASRLNPAWQRFGPGYDVSSRFRRANSPNASRAAAS